jgi:hypothetical protein
LERVGILLWLMVAVILGGCSISSPGVPSDGTASGVARVSNVTVASVEIGAESCVQPLCDLVLLDDGTIERRGMAGTKLQATTRDVARFRDELAGLDPADLASGPFPTCGDDPRYPMPWFVFLLPSGPVRFKACASRGEWNAAIGHLHQLVGGW